MKDDIAAEAEEYLRNHVVGQDAHAAIQESGRRFSTQVATAIAAMEAAAGRPAVTVRSSIADVLRKMADAIENGELPPLPSEN